MFKAIFEFVNRFPIVLITLGVTGIAIGMGVASAGEYNPITNCYDDPSGVAPPVCYGDNSQPQPATPKIGYDPCYLKQNAMRPCERPSPTPVGVDRHIVGTWEVSVPNAQGVERWVWEIRPDGRYTFHAEGSGGTPAHSGTFAASQGHYVLDSTTSAWKDNGTYQVKARNTLVATGKLGTGSWHRVGPNTKVDSAAESGAQAAPQPLKKK
jgi:hypothetical protein